MAHITRDALARYLIRSGTIAERDGVAWHLEHCPACKEEFTAREIKEVGKQARARLVMAVRSSERN